MKTESKSDPPPHDFSHRSWIEKFRVAASGLAGGILGSNRETGLNSFLIHGPVAAGVLVAAGVFKVSGAEIAILFVCIGLVFVAELFNSSLELVSKSITDQPNEQIGAALDISAGAVLLASLIAVAAGCVILGPPALQWLSWSS